jgi:very-short-patch-repair endonuclease
VLHRADLLPDEHDRRCTRVLRTVLDCAATLPFAEALTVADSALREGLVRAEHLQDAAAERRGRGAAKVRRVAAAADGDAASALESVLRAVLLDAGITGFTPQLPVLLRNGVTVRVDLGDRRRRIVIEADSFEHHGGREALRRDCRRYDELVRAGWIVLRFAWEHVIGDPAWVVQVVAEVCAAADRRALGLSPDA